MIEDINFIWISIDLSVFLEISIIHVGREFEPAGLCAMVSLPTEHPILGN